MEHHHQDNQETDTPTITSVEELEMSVLGPQEPDGAGGTASVLDRYGLMISILLGCALIGGGIYGGLLKLAAGGGGIGSPPGTVATDTPTAPVAPTAPADPSAPVNITLKSGTPTLGNDKAKVTVVEYADFQCPFCERWFKDAWPTIKSKYVDTGKIKFAYQDFAFLGADSNTAAEASHCAADQNKFWQYHDYLFTNQGAENGGWANLDNQKKFAQSVGLNTSQFNQCMDSGKYKKEVLDQTAAAKTYGVSGTPTVFINGVKLVGAQPASAFEQAIDAALK